MTRGDKIKRFLTGGALVIGGILSLFLSLFLLKTGILVVGIILAAFGIVFFLGKSGKSLGGISLAIGAGLIAFNYWFVGIIYVIEILAILGGGYISYDTYKKLNAP